MTQWEVHIGAMNKLVVGDPMKDETDIGPMVRGTQRDKVDMNRFFDFVRKHTSYGGSYYAMTHHPDVRLAWHNVVAYKEGASSVQRTGLVRRRKIAP